MKSSKPYAGKIDNWYRLSAPAYKNNYGPSLGYVICGRLGEDHRNRGFDFGAITTSLVRNVIREDDQVFVETLNSLYELGTPAEPTEYRQVNTSLDEEPNEEEVS